MGDDQQRAGKPAFHFLKHFDQSGKAPQVDARLRFVEDGDAGAPGENGGDFHPFDLPAGEGGADLPVRIFPGAQPHLPQQVAQAFLPQLISRCQLQQIPHGQSLKAHGLLKGVADSQLGPLGHVQADDILPVQQQAAGGGLFQTGDNLGQGGFAAAVRAGHHRHPAAGYGQVHSIEYFFTVR